VEELGERIRKFSYAYIVRAARSILISTMRSQKSNTKVIFDVMNEPNGIDAQAVFNLVREFSPSPP